MMSNFFFIIEKMEKKIKASYLKFYKEKKEQFLQFCKNNLLYLWSFIKVNFLNYEENIKKLPEHIYKKSFKYKVYILCKNRFTRDYFITGALILDIIIIISIFVPMYYTYYYDISDILYGVISDYFKTFYFICWFLFFTVICFSILVSIVFYFFDFIIYKLKDKFLFLNYEYHFLLKLFFNLCIFIFSIILFIEIYSSIFNYLWFDIDIEWRKSFVDGYNLRNFYIDFDSNPNRNNRIFWRTIWYSVRLLRYGVIEPLLFEIKDKFK